MKYNVAWIITRHHNLKQVTKILDSEAEILVRAKMEDLADELIKYSGLIHSLMITDLECIELKLEAD